MNAAVIIYAGKITVYHNVLQLHAQISVFVLLNVIEMIYIVKQNVKEMNV